VEVPSPANKDFSPEGSILARNVIEAVAAGSQIQCNAKQYPAIRAVLTDAAEIKTDMQDNALPRLALSEIERLDRLFLNSAGHTVNCTERPITQEINTTASTLMP